MVASQPAALGLIPSIPTKKFSEKIIDVAEVNQWRGLEESRQWLENVDRLHLVLASSKPVQQKKLHCQCGHYLFLNKNDH